MTRTVIEGQAASIPPDHPVGTDIHAEHLGWHTIVSLIRRLMPHERLEPGYYTDPDWSVRDLVAHMGTWLAEGQIQLERMRAGTYEGHDVDIDAMNAAFLEAMRGQPWSVTWVQAHAARTKLLEEFYALSERTDEAAWWIRKVAAEHYSEHLPRLQEWTDELIARRPPGLEVA